MDEVVRMMPLWGDRCVAEAHPRRIDGYTWFPTLIGGPLGLPLHDRFLFQMTLSDKRAVDVAVATMLSVLRLDRLDPELAVRAALGRHAAGSLDLASVNWFSWIAFEFGGLRGLWPSLLETAAALCEVPDPPAELSDLLRLLAEYAHEVPEPVIPEALQTFATSDSKQPGRAEARALVEALKRAAENALASGALVSA
jgi:hypothetical protein